MILERALHGLALKNHTSNGGRHLSLTCLLKSERYENKGWKGRWLNWPQLVGMVRLKEQKSRVRLPGGL